MKIINNILLLFIFIITLSFPNFSFAKELKFSVGLENETIEVVPFDGTHFFGNCPNLGESKDETLCNREEHFAWGMFSQEILKMAGVRSKLILNFVAPMVALGGIWEPTNDNPNPREVPGLVIEWRDHKDRDYFFGMTLDTMYFEFHF